MKKMRNVIHNENVKQVQKVITSLLVEYISNNDHDIISEKSCVHHVFDFFSHLSCARSRGNMINPKTCVDTAFSDTTQTIFCSRDLHKYIASTST